MEEKVLEDKQFVEIRRYIRYTELVWIIGGKYMSNRLLNALDNISGNNQSQQSVNNASTTNTHASSTFAQEEQLINSAEQDLQTNLNALNIQNQNNNLFGNSKFVASAQWVKTKCDHITKCVIIS